MYCILQYSQAGLSYLSGFRSRESDEKESTKPVAEYDAFEDTKVKIVKRALAPTDSDLELQVVAYVYVGAEQYRVYAPGIADTDALDWLWNMTVRNSLDENAPESQRILVLKYVEGELNKSAAVKPQKQPKFTKPTEIVAPFHTYKLGDKIKKGSSSVLYNVTDSEGKPFALKVMLQPHGKTLARFQNEIDFCYTERSKHIVKIVEYGRTQDGYTFYVMPYYPGTLRELITKKISPGIILPLYAQLLDGVEAAHLFGVTHRDIKPENILYSNVDNLIVLADFGISRFKKDDLLVPVETAPHEKLANFTYAAPEQKTPSASVDHRADIYALGLILNEMFTGVVPQGTDVKRIRDVDPTFAYLDDLVDWMMRQDPDKRPKSVAAIKEQLIARKNDFVQQQRVDALKGTVIQDSEVDDPIISDPIRAVETLDFEAGVLSIRLNQRVNPKWERIFRNKATAYSASVSAGRIQFRGDRALIQSDERNLQAMVNYFRQYIGATNEEYAGVIRAEHAAELNSQRNRLQNEIKAQEAKVKLLKGVVL